MSYNPPNVAPPGCKQPRCVHLLEHRTIDGPNDWCGHPKRVGCKGCPPMHEGCSWKETAEDLRVRAEREGSL